MRRHFKATTNFIAWSRRSVPTVPRVFVPPQFEPEGPFGNPADDRRMFSVSLAGPLALGFWGTVFGCFVVGCVGFGLRLYLAIFGYLLVVLDSFFVSAHTCSLLSFS